MPRNRRPGVKKHLYEGLRFYWPLQEASGTRFEAHASAGQHLTDNNTVTQATGPTGIGQAAQFVRANSEYLRRGHEAAQIHGDSSIHYVAWVYLDTKPAEAIVIAKHDASLGSDMQLRYTGGATDRFDGFWRDSDEGGSPTTTVTANTFGSPATATWYMLDYYHDPVANQIGIGVNAANRDTATHTAGVTAGGTAPFFLGTDRDGGLSFWDGRITAVGRWDRILSTRELEQLYDGGRGLRLY